MCNPTAPNGRTRRLISLTRATAFCILSLALLTGCASTAHIPMPAWTPYDSNPKARQAYLAAYRAGYRYGLEGHGSPPASFGNDNSSDASGFGWFHGLLAGATAADQQHQPKRQ